MEQLGYPIPDIARNLALQEDKFARISISLKKMLDNYHMLLASLDDSETLLLESHLHDLKRTIRPGAKRLNWSALGINDYLTKCNSNISKLESMVNQIKKNSKDIQQFLGEIQSVDLFPKPALNADGSLTQCQNYFEFIEAKRRQDMAEIAKKYKLIGPLVTKVEGLVFGTNSSKQTKMISYYNYWEKEIYNTILKMIVSNLTNFNNSLTLTDPLFQIETILAIPDISFYPSQNELGKLIKQCVRDCIEVANYFPRWMNGTCKECLPVKAEGQDESYLYTYLPDIVNSSEIFELASHIQANAQRTVQNMKKNLMKWKKFKSLWKSDKLAICEKFFAKNPSVIAFDEKMLYYNKMVEEIHSYPKFSDIEFVRLSMRSLSESLVNHANEWIKCLGKLLNDTSKENLYELKNKLNVILKIQFKYYSLIFIYFLTET